MFVHAAGARAVIAELHIGYGVFLGVTEAQEHLCSFMGCAKGLDFSRGRSLHPPDIAQPLRTGELCGKEAEWQIRNPSQYSEAQ
jgi:hypothetical protein